MPQSKKTKKPFRLSEFTEYRNARVAGLKSISVNGFKSLVNSTALEIGGITLLAGANSSGKSSIMQPLLLLKQTLESSFDPGGLLINGPNIAFTSASEMLSRGTKKAESFSLRIDFGLHSLCQFNFHVTKERDLQVRSMRYDIAPHKIVTLRVGMSESQVLHLLPPLMRKNYTARVKDFGKGVLSALRVDPSTKRRLKLETRLTTHRRRPFIEPATQTRVERGEVVGTSMFQPVLSIEILEEMITSIIHVPGIRKMPARAYPIAAVEKSFPGTFPEYTGSVIAHWEKENNPRLKVLNQWLEKLDLNSKVHTVRRSGAEVEVLVNRIKGSSKRTDLVNMADVGIGVSQVLPVLVAILSATMDSTVYVEQPELHLHPRAQKRLAEIFSDAARRGVRIIAETHSSQLLLGLQTAVAKKQLPPDRLKLHWFETDARGVTSVNTARVNSDGTVGNWPQDFDDVTMESQGAFLDAVAIRNKEKSIAGPKNRR